MKIKQLLEKLESNSSFKEWKRQKKDSYLAHIFRMLDDPNQKDWQLGFYNPDDTITTFIIEPDDIKIIEEQQIFKKDKKKVKKLDIDKIKIEFDQAEKIADENQDEHYHNEKPIKKIYILQDLDIGQVWNVTFVTQRFNTLNMKIDAGSGKIKEQKLTSLMQMGEVVKGKKD